MPKFRIPLKVVLYFEDEQWFAHCLEMDLLGHGDTREAAMCCLCDAITVQIDESIAHGNIANIFMPAESRFYEMFSVGDNVAVGECELHLPDGVEVEQLETREYHGELAYA